MKNEIRLNKSIVFFAFSLMIISFPSGQVAYSQEKETITAIYIPLADHYPGIVAYEMPK